MFTTGVTGNKKCDVDMESPTPYVFDVLKLFVSLVL